MEQNKLEIQLTTEPNETVKDYLKAGLTAFNDQYTDQLKLIREGKNTLHLSIFEMDREGKIVGALMGRIYWNWLSIDDFFVDRSHRGMGLGSRLIREAEQQARAKNCKHALVKTFSFQAQPFYEKHGFEVCGILEDYPPGHQIISLAKHF